MKITEMDGIHVENGRKYVADSRSSSGDVNIVSHAHFDHLHMEPGTKVVASELTAELAEARTGEELRISEEESVELIDSGHILGSRSALIETEDARVLYTGDFSPRSRLYMEGFEPVDADVLVTESTYGVPNYVFPDQRELEARISDWLEDNSDETLFLFGYSLGKAQKIQQLVQRETSRTLVAHGAVKRMNDTVEELTELEFRALPYSENKDKLESGDAILVGPTRFSGSDAVRKMVEKTGGVKAGFSGWALDDSFRFRGDYDVGFPLSDHADFRELVKTVQEVDPDRVYLTHGFSDALSSHLSSELGYDARALKNNQSSLKDF